MTKRKALLPCPFCDTSPRLSDWSRDYPTVGAQVACENESCAIRPHTDPSGYKENEVIAQWNTRVALAARGKSDNDAAARLPSGSAMHPEALGSSSASPSYAAGRADGFALAIRLATERLEEMGYGGWMVGQIRTLRLPE